MEFPLNRRSFIATAAAFTVGSLAGAVTASDGAADAAAGSGLQTQKLAWAGVRLQLEKAALFLDPLINPDVWGPALKDKFIAVEPLEGERYVLVTHRHPDHFDPQAIRKILGEAGIIACDPDVAPLAASYAFKVRVANHYEPILLGDFTVTAVPAVDGYGDPQLSWVVVGGGRRIIHCGDTMWHGAWWRIGRQLGPFDAAFLPINGARFEWRKPWSDVPAVMTPEQAVAAAVVLGAKLVVPIHYGVIGAEGYREVPDCEAVLIKAARERKVNVQVVRPGDWVKWPASTA